MPFFASSGAKERGLAEVRGLGLGHKIFMTTGKQEMITALRSVGKMTVWKR